MTFATVMQCYEVVLVFERSVWFFGRGWEQTGETSVYTVFFGILH